MHSFPESLQALKEKLLLAQALTSFAQASYFTFWALFFVSIGLTYTQTGFFIVLLTIFSLLALVSAPKLLRQHHSLKTLIHLLFFSAIAFTLLALPAPVWFILTIAIVLTVCAVTTTTLFHTLFFEISTKDLFKEKNYFIIIIDVAWFIAPYLSGLIAHYYDLPAIFLFSAVILFVASLFLLSEKNTQISRKESLAEQQQIFVAIKKYFSKTTNARAYYSSLTPSIWAGLLYVYVPIYLFINEYSLVNIGLFIVFANVLTVLGSANALSFTAVFGKKRLLLNSYTAIFVGLFFVLSIQTILFQLITLLFLSAVIGLLSSLNKKDTFEKDDLRVYETNKIMGFLLAQIVFATALLVFPIKAIFFVTSLILVPFFWLFLRTNIIQK